MTASPAATRDGAKVMVVILAVLLGYGTAQGSAVPMLIAAAMMLLTAAVRIGIAGWVGLLLATAVLPRILIDAASLPIVLAFLHYPLTILFFGLSLTRRSGQQAAGIHSAWTRWGVALGGIVVASAATTLTSPLRVALFVLVTGQILFVAASIALWPRSGRLRPAAITATAIVVVQLPIGAIQFVATGNADQVQGTLVGHGAGAHIFGGLLALATFVLVGHVMQGRLSPIALVPVLPTVALAMFASDAKQVIASALLGGIAAWAFSLQSNRAKKDSAIHFVGRLAAVGAVSALVVIAVIGPAQRQRVNALSNDGSFPAVDALLDSWDAGPATFLLGHGPGSGASRASILLTTEMLRSDSPLRALNLEPTEVARAAVRVTTSQQAGGSLESLSSGFLSILTDLGVVGLAAVLLLVGWLWRQLSGGGAIAWAARASLAMTAVLSLVDVWFEYPEFAIPLGVLLGIGLREPPQVVRPRQFPTDHGLPRSPSAVSRSLPPRWG